MATGMGVAEIQKKSDRPGTLIDMILAGTPFTLDNNKQFTATEFSGTILGIQSSKTNIKDYSKNQVKRDREKIIKSIESLPKGASSKILLYGKINSGPADQIIPSNQIQKSAEFGGKAGAPSTTPSTAQQEQVTLKIFEILLKRNGYNPHNKSEDILANDFKKFAEKDLIKLWPGIMGDSKGAVDWYKHFYLQFKDIESTTKLPNDVFDFYNYDDFMNFIKDLVIAGPPAPSPEAGRTKKWPVFGTISQKDSWNPADVWLVNKGTAYKELLKQIEQAKYISQVNRALQEAFKGKNNGGVPVVAGISLKKSTGKVLHYELVNLAYKASALAQVEYVGMNLDIVFDKDGNPEKVTNMMTVMELTSGFKPDKKAQMRIGSAGTDNLNLEFSAPGQAAQLGKVPKDLAEKRLQGIPGLGNAHIPNGKEALLSIPDATNDAKAKIWRDKLAKIMQYSGGGKKGILTIVNKKQTIDRFVVNITNAKKSARFRADYEQKVLINVQIIEFAYLLTQVYQKTRSREGFDDFIEDLYYYAQKKGKGFGPFGKLY